MQLNKIHTIDALEGLKQLPDESIQCCVTSPPYYQLRDYQVQGQIGLEETIGEYISKMVSVFNEVKRVLRKDGTLWVNMGDSYAAGKIGRDDLDAEGRKRLSEYGHPGKSGKNINEVTPVKIRKLLAGLKPKDLIGVPWQLAFALRNEGWYLRCDIVWAKKNCMPESVTDRPTRSHEYIFLLSKSPKYYYDAEAIKEPAIYDVDGTGTASRKARASGNKLSPNEKINGIRPAGFKDAGLMNDKNADKERGHSRRHNGFNDRWDKMTHEEQCTGMRNKRDVWSISPAQFPEAHFATFPEEIPEICIKAGSKVGDTILDPFMGAGTTALVARKLERKFIGFELNPKYVEIANNRLKKELGMFL
jgi:DNA modification methylase